MTRRLFHKKKPFPLWASVSLLIAGLGFGYLLLPDRPPPVEKPAQLAGTVEPAPAVMPPGPPPPALLPHPMPLPGFGADMLSRPGSTGAGSAVRGTPADQPVGGATAGGEAAAPAPAPSSAPPPAATAAAPTAEAPAGIAAAPALVAGDAATAAAEALPVPVARQRPPLPAVQRAEARGSIAAPDTASIAAAAPEAVPTPALPTVAVPPPSPPAAPADVVAERPPTAPEAGSGQVTRRARVQLTSLVRDREPVDSLQSVASGQPVYGFSEIRGLAGRSVEHRWQHEGRTVASMRLRIGGDRWRVHSRKPSAPGRGEWEFIVLDDEGTVLGRTRFVVE